MDSKVIVQCSVSVSQNDLLNIAVDTTDIKETVLETPNDHFQNQSTARCLKLMEKPLLSGLELFTLFFLLVLFFGEVDVSVWYTPNKERRGHVKSSTKLRDAAFQ